MAAMTCCARICGASIPLRVGCAGRPRRPSLEKRSIIGGQSQRHIERHVFVEGLDQEALGEHGQIGSDNDVYKLNFQHHVGGDVRRKLQTDLPMLDAHSPRAGHVLFVELRVE